MGTSQPWTTLWTTITCTVHAWYEEYNQRYHDKFHNEEERELFRRCLERPTATLIAKTLAATFCCALCRQTRSRCSVWKSPPPPARAQSSITSAPRSLPSVPVFGFLRYHLNCKERAGTSAEFFLEFMTPEGEAEICAVHFF
ncbi:hypothetical protein FN846DRAFT_981541 [Sphaerosporella brunnea]|uniref:Uncharacterized protein n=1 Tax=Sphaerosporella brunnea TaxID=1250544 RepID=A0A5J5EC87_9PEZI|nr:hypothetical protein FN846DRAFT_981541 [Sphaerosporella brunnea]